VLSAVLPPIRSFQRVSFRYDWKLAEAKKNILRTHTTAVSARVLEKLAQEKPFKPRRYFSIDRVFRNESLDATHLAEFHQVEVRADEQTPTRLTRLIRG
jgi:phenylalanyl-tRNA synthetase alpha chain